MTGDCPGSSSSTDVGVNVDVVNVGAEESAVLLANTLVGFGARASQGKIGVISPGSGVANTLVSILTVCGIAGYGSGWKSRVSVDMR